MAIDAAAEKSMPKDKSYYIEAYRYFFIALTSLLGLSILLAGFILYQLATRPLPRFQAVLPDQSAMRLQPFESPSLLPETIIRFASKAAVTAYTFDFVNYDGQLSQAKPFFTPAGWADFRSSISGLVSSVVQGQLFVNGVVVGTPVISNQGPLPGRGYVWRVQIPFLVTFQSANTLDKKRYMVAVTIVHVPTSDNPQGIGIDQFVTR